MAKWMSVKYRHAQYYYNIVYNCDSVFQSGGLENIKHSFEDFRTNWIQIQHSQSHLANQIPSLPDSSNLCIEYALTARQLLIEIFGNKSHAKERLYWHTSALAAAIQMGRKDAQAQLIANIATCFSDLDEIDAALQHFNQALILSRELGDLRTQAVCFNNLGSLLWRQRKIDESIQSFINGANCAREIGDIRLCSQCLANMGTIMMEEFQFEEGENRLTEALALARQSNAYTNVLFCLRNLSMLRFRLGDYAGSITIGQEALLIAEQIGETAAILGNLGLAYRRAGRSDMAKEYHHQAFLSYKNVNNKTDQGRQLANLGLAHAEIEEFETAIQYYEQALVIHRDIGDQIGIGNQLGNLGLSYTGLKMYEKAIACYDQAIEVQAEINDRRGIANQFSNKGLSLLEMGEFESALDLFLKAKEMYANTLRTPHMVEWIDGHIRRARLQRAMKQPSKRD